MDFDYKQMGDLFAVIDSRINKNNVLNQVPGTYVAKVVAVAPDGHSADVQIMGDEAVLAGLKNKTGVCLNVADEVMLFAPKNDLTNVYISESKFGTTIDGANINTILWNQIDNMDAIALRTDLNWDNLANKPTDLLNQADLATALTSYVTTGEMTTALADTLNTGNFNTIITKAYIASMNLIVGNEITMGSNATISWNNVTDQPSLSGYTDAQALQAWKNSGYATSITSTGAYIGNIVANNITTGTLTVGNNSNVRLDVTDYINFKDGLVYIVNQSGNLLTLYSQLNNIMVEVLNYDFVVGARNFVVGCESHFSTSGSYTDPWNSHSCAGKFSGDVGIGGTLKSTNLSVTGSKACMQSTLDYGDRLITAYETAEYYFGDLGTSKIIEATGTCTIIIDDIFQECINVDIPYHVFCQAYNGSITSIDREQGYFVVTGEIGTNFSWEIKAKRLGYENNRLNKPVA